LSEILMPSRVAAAEAQAAIFQLACTTRSVTRLPKSRSVL
jgi:hypothetical protein